MVGTVVHGYNILDNNALKVGDKVSASPAITNENLVSSSVEPCGCDMPIGDIDRGSTTIVGASRDVSGDFSIA